MKFNKKSTRVVEVESYVTFRQEWPVWASMAVQLEYNFRGIRIVDGKMEWQYFEDEIEAKKWADAVHKF